jgi:hypothetical protein
LKKFLKKSKNKNILPFLVFIFARYFPPLDAFCHIIPPRVPHLAVWNSLWRVQSAAPSGAAQASPGGVCGGRALRAGRGCLNEKKLDNLENFHFGTITIIREKKDLINRQFAIIIRDDLFFIFDIKITLI